MRSHSMTHLSFMSLAALLLALPVPWWPALAIPAGALLTCAHLVQAANLYRACARYAERLGATRAVKVA